MSIRGSSVLRRVSIASVSTETNGLRPGRRRPRAPRAGVSTLVPVTVTRSHAQPLRAVQQPDGARAEEDEHDQAEDDDRTKAAGPQPPCRRRAGRLLLACTALGGGRSGHAPCPFAYIEIQSYRRARRGRRSPRTPCRRAVRRRPGGRTRRRRGTSRTAGAGRRARAARVPAPTRGQFRVVDQQSAAGLDHRLGVQPLFAVADGQRDVGGRAARRRRVRRRSSRPRGRASCRPRRTRGPSGPRTVPGYTGGIPGICSHLRQFVLRADRVQDLDAGLLQRTGRPAGPPR